MADDDRTVVKTYIPRYQKEIWNDHAEKLEMSQSEFVRTMVQSGRQGFEISTPAKSSNTDLEADDSSLEDRILAALDQNNVLDWDEIVDTLVADIEEDIDTSLGKLQDENRVRYSGRDGGYIKTNNE
jgi:hypothetical protein